MPQLRVCPVCFMIVGKKAIPVLYSCSCKGIHAEPAHVYACVTYLCRICTMRRPLQCLPLCCCQSLKQHNTCRHIIALQNGPRVQNDGCRVYPCTWPLCKYYEFHMYLPEEVRPQEPPPKLCSDCWAVWSPLHCTANRGLCPAACSGGSNLSCITANVRRSTPPPTTWPTTATPCATTVCCLWRSCQRHSWLICHAASAQQHSWSP